MKKSESLNAGGIEKIQEVFGEITREELDELINELLGVCTNDPYDIIIKE